MLSVEPKLRHEYIRQDLNDRPWVDFDPHSNIADWLAGRKALLIEAAFHLSDLSSTHTSHQNLVFQNRYKKTETVLFRT